MRKLLFILSIFTGSLQAQELNCTVNINAEQTGQSNLQVFRTLKSEITEFMNKTNWTDLNIKQQEKIDCSLVIIVSNINSDFFTASIQVQSSRPVYNSTYNTPILNFNDRQFNFEYTEFQPLNYNANTFDSNLISVLAFYAYTIIGLDAASYELGAGEPYFEEAKQIVNTAQQQVSDGWSPQSGTQSRYRLNQDLLSPNFREFFDAMYAYHRNGLDYMAQSDREAKQSIAISLGLFEQLYRNRPNNFLTRVFFDSKAEEIASIFSGGPQVNISSLVSMLNKVAPTKSTYWQQIKL
ncbi:MULTISPECIES: DUF4835 family protein [unclassified Leeuwenhoekiella]|uniref:type IX secretion system protein PorD n=1 Tax=unclassified Leeuwenhoekiella TaxID=2615029 RepID=UPI000C3AEFAF|nr:MULTISPECIES: DUF4835 family protein [unclassified Leeuwenhoekiella]MAW94613.1 DUF4835 domain-containing protein [Leeuwenhoekiella sp.]MBA82036.1 DUF4835 domain-containing protein [Leeuwenhoekiella sp.]|tara:strand:- start:82 stop:966 length:885 start_codon:yes stop_codon:yes gene_type:complete